MNQEFQNKSKIELLNETLSDPKMIAGIVGLGLCSPVLLPWIVQSFPVATVVFAKCNFITMSKISSLLINGGLVTLGGISSTILADILKDMIKKEKI